MKTLKTLFLGLGALLATLSFNSCLDDDNSYNGNWGIVTVKPLSSEAYYLQLDDSTTMLPVNSRAPHFGLDKERRARVFFTLVTDSTPKNYDYAGIIDRIDSILTKTIVPSLGEKNDEVYGDDAIDLNSVWIEDGYINFQFTAYFGGSEKHFINLVQMDETKPYELEFRHNAYNDPWTSTSWGLAAFKLNTLPDTEGKDVALKIKFKSYQGDKTFEIKYNSKRPTSGKAPVVGSRDYQMLN